MVAIVMNRVLHFGAERGRSFGGEPDFHTLHGLHGNDRLRESPVEARVPGNVRSEPRGHAARDHFEDAAHGVARFIGVIDHRFHFLFGFGIHAIQKHFVAFAQFFSSSPRCQPAEDLGIANRDYVAQDVNAELREISFSEGAHGDPGSGFARASAALLRI